MIHNTSNDPITIVTAYYRIGKAKHTFSQYKTWIKNFLCNVKHSLVIFTDKEHAPYFLKLRKKYLKNTAVIIKEFHQLNEYAQYEMWKCQQVKDTKINICRAELYIIWNEKIHFIKEASELNIFNSEWFMWMDIGAFRNNKYDYDLNIKEINHWPAVERLDTIPKNKITFTKVDKKFDLKYYKNRKNIAKITLLTKNHVGGLFILPISIVSKVHNLINTVKKQRLDIGHFIGNDQDNYIYFIIVYPEYVHLLDPPKNLSPWFYFHHYFLPEKLLYKKLHSPLNNRFKEIIKRLLFRKKSK